MESDSAQNLISKAQVHEVIKSLNVSNIGLPFYFICIRFEKGFSLKMTWSSSKAAIQSPILTKTRCQPWMTSFQLTLSTRTRLRAPPCTPQTSEEVQELLSLNGRREQETTRGTISSMELSSERLHHKNKSSAKRLSILRDKLSSLGLRSSSWLKFWNLRGKTLSLQCSSKIPRTLMWSRSSENPRSKWLTNYPLSKRNWSCTNKN